MQNPVVSAEEQQNLSSFFQKLPTKRKEQWTSTDFLSSPRDSSQGSELQTHEDWSIIDELPLESKIREPIPIPQQNHAKGCEIDEVIEQFRSFNPQNSSFGPSSSLSSNSQTLEKVINTLSENANNVEVYEQIQAQVIYSNISSATLKNFTALVQRRYHPYVENIKKIFLKMKEYSKQQLESIKLYVNFLEIKMKQQIESLKAFDEIQSMLESDQAQNKEKTLMGEYGIVFLDQFNQTNSHKKNKINKFYKQIKDIYEQLLSLSSKISQKRFRKEKFIQESILSQIELIQQEMMDIIRCRLLNAKQKCDFRYISQKLRSKNRLLMKDKYLELKYLMKRQRTYIDLIMDLKGKIINYMVSIFSKETLQTSKQITQCLMAYANSYREYYQGQGSALQIINLDQRQSEMLIINELSELLISFIPQDMLKDTPKLATIRPNTNKMDCVLNQISSIIQNTIFTTTIQMDNDYIVFRNEALLRTVRSILQKQEDNLEYERKQESSKQKQRSSILASYMLTHETKIQVVLTSNSFLHLERQEKIFTIDPNTMKISRKGREVIITNRKKGINRILSHHSELAKLQFENSQDVDLFMDKLALTARKQTP